MNGGRIEQIGTPIEVYRRPETVFVAGFIGSPPMNLVDLDELGPCNLALPRDTDLLGIRPSAINLGDGAAHDLRFDANVELIETVGDENNVHLRIDGSDKRIVASVSTDRRLQEGDRTSCHVRRDGLHPFNRTTGRRTD